MTPKSKKSTTKTKRVKKKGGKHLDFSGRIEVPFPVRVIWDDAYHNSGQFEDQDELEDVCCGPFYSESFGKLYFASREDVILVHFNHIDVHGKVTNVRFPFRIATPMVFEIIELATGETIYLKKGI